MDLSGDLRVARVEKWPSRTTRALVILFHGGQEHSVGRVHRGRLAYLRMRPFARALRRAGRGPGLDVWLLRYRYRGWNEPSLDPVRDAQWVLEQARAAHPGVPVVLVGHSMGGRVALRVAGDPAVVAVAALAPWLPKDEPVEQLARRTVLIAHGDQDRMTSPKLSYLYAARAKQVTDRICRFDVHGESHAMLRRAGEWTDLVERFVLGVLQLRPLDAEIADALSRPGKEGLRAALAGVRP